MSNITPAAKPDTVAAWLATPLGQYVLAREQSYIDKTVADVFGYNALQIGATGIDLLRANRMALRFALGLEDGAQVRANAIELPVASLDVLPTQESARNEADDDGFTMSSLLRRYGWRRY